MRLKTFFENLFPFLYKAMQREWDQLTPVQQAAVINAGQIGQLLKTNLTLPGNDLVMLITKQTGLSEQETIGTLIELAKKFGLITTSVTDGVSFLQGKLSSASSDEEWNGILSIILNAGGILLSGGMLNWAQLAIGIGEWVYLTFVKQKI